MRENWRNRAGRRGREISLEPWVKSLLHKFEFNLCQTHCLGPLKRTTAFFFTVCLIGWPRRFDCAGISDSIGPLGFANVIAMDLESSNLAAYSIT